MTGVLWRAWHEDPSFSPKLGANSRWMRLCIAMQRVSDPNFLKIRSIAMNSSDQCLNHLFIKFTVYSLLFPAFEVRSFRWSTCNDFRPSLNLLCRSDTLILDEYTSFYALLNNPNFSVAVCLNFTQNLIASLCPVFKPWVLPKTTLDQNNSNPRMHEPNKLKCAHHIHI